MGWRGFIRSVAAAQRRSERASQRQHRELEKRRALYARMAERERAAYEVDVYENRIDLLRSVHKECGPAWDWTEIRRSQPPEPPVLQADSIARAQAEIDNYEPSFFARLFGREQSYREKLQTSLEETRRNAEIALSRDQAAHAEELDAWRDRQELADRLFSGDEVAVLDVIKEAQPYEEINLLGSQVRICVYRDAPLEVNITVNGESVVPSEVKSLLASGKLSTKKMPQGQFNELYQDYVCACVIRLARETFAVLPIDEVIVNAIGDILNTSNGHIEAEPIVSVFFVRATLQRLNFETIDPSDSLRNFVHRMDFKKGRGFAPVTALDSAEVGR